MKFFNNEHSRYNKRLKSLRTQHGRNNERTTMGQVIKKNTVKRDLRTVSSIDRPLKEANIQEIPKPKVKKSPIVPTPYVDPGHITAFTKVKKIMFVQATRGRPGPGIEAALRITRNMRSNMPFSYYFSLDTDDPTLPEYRKNISHLPFVSDICVGNNKGCVDATNAGALRLSDEDLIVVSGDDMAIRQVGWDMYVLDFIERNISTDEYLVHFPDETANSKEIAIYQILSAPLYRKMGFIFYPEYISMYGDNDLWATCNRLGVIHNFRSPPNPLLFYHDHPGLGGAMEWDDTYKRTNDASCYRKGEEVFKRRELENFPIRGK